MKGRIIGIEYGQELPIKIKVPKQQSTDEIKKSIAKFKQTDTYKSDEWSDDDLLIHLQSDGINYQYVPAYSDETIYINEL